MASRFFSLSTHKPLIIILFFLTSSSPARGDDYFDPSTIERQGHLSQEIDLSSFSQPGGQLPGIYNTDVYVNGHYADQQNILFERYAGKLRPVLTKALYTRWGIAESATPAFMHLSTNQPVADITQFIPEVRITVNITQQRLDITVPQQYFKQQARGYIDPAQWDEGLTMLFLNYGYSGANTWSDHRGHTHSAYFNLQNGINLGAWRLRNYTTYTHHQNSGNWNSINTYLQRGIKSLKSQWVIGESYTPSDVFNSFAFRGMQLYSDESMQPESVRGFAPVVRGIARSNAQVTIRQGDNIIWQSYVPPGPFSINDLYPTSAGGELNISLQEADGTVRQFVQPFTSVPIMQREGHFKYALTAGQSRATTSRQKKLNFIQPTGIYGLTSATTLYGGTILSNHYLAASLGIGKGLGTLGSISLDGTLTNTMIHGEKNRGGVVRLQYSKDVALSGTTFTLAGYRYSSSGYYDFNEANSDNTHALPWRDHGDNDDQPDTEQATYHHGRYNQRSKAQININQTLDQHGSLFLSAYQQQYSGLAGKERSINLGYNVSLLAMNYSLNYSYSETPYYQNADHLFSCSLQIPLERFFPTSSLNLSSNTNHRGASTSTIGLTGTVLADNNLAYNVQQGYTTHSTGAYGSASLDYKTRRGQYQASYHYTRQTHQVNYGVMGGIVLHPYGLTFAQPLGETMALINTKGANEVKVQNNAGIYTDNRGYAIVPYVTPYYRNRLTLDTATLKDDIDILNDTQTVVPTKGALVLAEYPTVSGQKMRLILEGQGIPFGANATVKNDAFRIQGIVDNRQRVYLSGVPSQGVVHVSWHHGHCLARYQIPLSSVPVPTVTATCQ